MQAERIPYFWISAYSLYLYLKAVVAGATRIKAFCKHVPYLHYGGAYRYFRRISIPHIREHLYRLDHDPPPGDTPLASTVDHLYSLFQTSSPIATFQIHFQTAFLKAGD